MFCRKSWDDIKTNELLAAQVKAELRDYYDCEIHEDDIETILYFQPEIFTKAVLNTLQIDYED